MAVSEAKRPLWRVTVSEVKRLTIYNGYMQRPFATDSSTRSGVNAAVM
jgi:hypothetical protein